MPDIPTVEPERIRAGETVRWTKSLSGFDPATDTLTYGFAKEDGTEDVDVAVVDNGDGSFLSTIDDADSATMAAGSWRWVATVEDVGGILWTVGEGSTEVMPAPADGTDSRSWAKKQRDDIEAVLSGSASRATLSGYSLNNRSMSYASRAELYDERARLSAIVSAEENEERIRAGKGNRNRIVSRFD